MGVRAPRAALAALALALALAWSALLASWHLDGQATLLDRAEAPLLDLRFALSGPRPAPADLVIVALDDDTVREAGSFPLPRSTMARLVREAARQGAKAVALDVLFLNPGPEAEDRALAEALRETGAVIAAAGLFARTGAAEASAESGTLEEIPVADRVLWPVERFGQAAGIGSVNVATDHAGTPRHIPLALRVGPALLPSFSLRTAARAARADPAFGRDHVTVGGAVAKTDFGLHLPLRFYGPRGTVKTVSAGAVLRGDLPDGGLRDRVVLVGATAVGAGDTFATPFDPVLPGVEVLATAIGHLLNGDGLVRDLRVRRFDAAASVALAVGAALLLSLAPPGLGLGLVGLAALGWLGLTALAFQNGVWLSAALPLAAMAAPAALAVVGRQVLDGRWTRRLASAEEALRRFQPPALAGRIAQDPAFLMKPVAQQASVVFLDLTGFTGFSERLGPDHTQAFLKAFHALVEAEANAHGGLVMNFMGDGAMLVFGLPEPGPEDARRALGAAVDLVPRIQTWLAARPEAGDLDIRVGAHHGPVVMSRLGAADHEQITASGDSVNVASRLLEVAKSLDAALVVSDDLLAAAGALENARSAFDGRRAVDIRGRRQPLTVAFRWVRRPERSEAASL